VETSPERPAAKEDGRRPRKEAIKAANEQRGRERHRPEREPEAPVGFGDDVPDFMKIPGKV